MPTPFLIFGDAPGQPSGLARILTDLAVRLQAHAIDLDLDVAVCGYAPFQGLSVQGQPMPGVRPELPYKNWVFSDFASRGAYALNAAWRYYFGIRPGIVFSIWDPARVEAVAQTGLPIKRWGYFAIDAMSHTGSITGPAGNHLRRYDRVLGYTKFGADVLQRTLEGHKEIIPYRYHGLEEAAFAAPSASDHAWVDQQVPIDREVLGCVATNQRRKYLPLFFQMLSASHDVYGWLHTDQLVSDAWSIPQLAADFAVEDRLTVTLAGMQVPMPAIYQRCNVTVAPGRGEGFGYPIVESLAQGTPALHFDYAGGGEITPEVFHCDHRDFTLEGVYNLLRPIPDWVDFQTRMKVALAHYQTPDHKTLYRKHARQFHWDTLWPDWLEWIKGGLS